MRMEAGTGLPGEDLCLQRPTAGASQDFVVEKQGNRAGSKKEISC